MKTIPTISDRVDVLVSLKDNFIGQLMVIGFGYDRKDVPRHIIRDIQLWKNTIMFTFSIPRA